MRFALKAVDAANQVVSVEVDAADEAAARHVARERGYAVLSVRGRGVALRRAAFPTTLFSIELIALLDAGLNVVEALQALAEKEAEGAYRRVLEDLLEALRRGESLSLAVSRFPEAFSSLYVATVRSSERTGNLKEALARYVAYAEEFDRVRKRVATAMLYPAILAVVGALVLAFLLFYVVPRFARVYDEISADLPFFSALLLGTGRAIEQHGLAVALGMTASSGIAVYLLSSRNNRLKLLELLWRIPALGERLRVYELARFYRTVGMLLRSGVPALRALDMVGGLLPLNLGGRLAQARVDIEQGLGLSAALTRAGLATAVASRMMAVGEKSGQMGELMERIARFHDDQTARSLDAFTRVFEPLLMAALGLAVGAVVVLMYMPIFELAGSIH